ncbi:unnamed protein product [Rotaria socialis]|uniref:Palmitoyl-protein hydrolase n=1 Tax=Rotaria socialis TaxID=392032 RepID=A0A817LEP6_9BILA|nr:unnamed protein product [Rotaria socialis]CAF4155697.1 unnamed protein product [Rotaria socialis]
MLRLIFLLFTTTVLSSSTYRPVVLMHGILSGADDMNELAGWIRASFPDIYVVSIEVGNGEDDSLLWPLEKQVEHFCASVLADEKLRPGFNMLGYSQGSIIVRGAVEKCSLPVHNLITLSGIHQVSKYAYESVVQDAISVPGYWRDPYQLNRYIADCHYLPDINNERDARNETYRDNMLKLNAFVMTYTDIDEVVTPSRSGWFMGYAPNTLDVETWNNSRQFKEDLIGMRTLLEQGKLYTFTSHVRHQDVPHAPNRDFIIENILPFFNNTLS